MAPFSAAHTVTLQSPFEPTWEKLSSEEAFLDFVNLSSLCQNIEITSTEPVKLPNSYLDEVLRDHETNVNRTRLNLPAGPEAATEEGAEALRIDWKLVERVPILGGLGHHNVEIVGNQIVVPSRHVHLYESSGNGGLVKILKIRRFEAGPDDGTKISELVRGETPWILRRYTESQCRISHTEHMDAYHTLLPKLGL